MHVTVIAAGDGYVAAAYLVFLFLVLTYLAIMAAKLARIEREVVELSDDVDRRAGRAQSGSQRAKAPVA